MTKQLKFQWDDDDFNLDSFGVEAPDEEVFQLAMEMGRKPEEVDPAKRARYEQYLKEHSEK